MKTLHVFTSGLATCPEPFRIVKLPVALALARYSRIGVGKVVQDLASV